MFYESKLIKEDIDSKPNPFMLANDNSYSYAVSNTISNSNASNNSNTRLDSGFKPKGYTSNNVPSIPIIPRKESEEIKLKKVNSLKTFVKKSSNEIVCLRITDFLNKDYLSTQDPSN